MKRFIKLKDIKIPADYKYPHSDRMIECANEFKEWSLTKRKALPCHITIDTEGRLVHGYAWYCILRKENIQEVKVREIPVDNTIVRKQAIYVYCTHFNEEQKEKEYVWQVTPNTLNAERICIGALVAVPTKNGLQTVRVGRIERSEYSPRPGCCIKEVLDCAPTLTHIFTHAE